MAIRIDRVDAGSEAEALGLAGGDELLSVDGNELNDTLDYDFIPTARASTSKQRWRTASGSGMSGGKSAAPSAATSPPIWATRSTPAPTTVCSASSTSCPGMP